MKIKAPEPEGRPLKRTPVSMRAATLDRKTLGLVVRRCEHSRANLAVNPPNEGGRYFRSYVAERGLGSREGKNGRQTPGLAGPAKYRRAKFESPGIRLNPGREIAIDRMPLTGARAKTLPIAPSLPRPTYMPNTLNRIPEHS
ncbi:hypothetical protein KM043_003834 [Ampulex compressa]|nr:hypothetical protein KM043_003834 [Ampulex compressa]